MDAPPYLRTGVRKTSGGITGNAQSRIRVNNNPRYYPHRVDLFICISWGGIHLPTRAARVLSPLLPHSLHASRDLLALLRSQFLVLPCFYFPLRGRFCFQRFPQTPRCRISTKRHQTNWRNFGRMTKQRDCPRGGNMPIRRPGLLELPHPLSQRPIEWLGTLFRCAHTPSYFATLPSGLKWRLTSKIKWVTLNEFCAICTHSLSASRGDKTHTM